MKTLIKRAIVPASILVSISFFAGAYLFQPWKLFVDTNVQEQIPSVVPSPSEVSVKPDPDETVAMPTPLPSKTPTVKETEAKSEKIDPVVLAQGMFISHEHSTSGNVRILQLADKSRVLRLENLDTSDGPKVEVWITNSPVIEGLDGWQVFDDGKYVSLGALKGNQGNQNYLIPNDMNLTEFSSVSLWCVTFSVSFGAAELNKLTS